MIRRILAFAAFSLVFASCSQKSLDEKKKCFEDKVQPLLQRTGKKVSWPEAKFDEGVLNRFADDCEFSKEEKSEYFITNKVQFAPKSQVPASPSVSSTPSISPRPSTSPNPSPTVTVSPSPSPTGSVKPTPSPTVTVTPSPTPTPSPTVTVTPTPSPTPTKPTTIPPHGSLSAIPVTDQVTVMAAVADDGVCRLRYFGASAGSQSGYNVLSGRRLLSSTPATDVATGIAQLKAAAKAGNCMIGAPERCQLRYRTNQLSGQSQGFYVAIEGSDMMGMGARSSKLSLDILTPLEAAGLCVRETPTPTCVIESATPPGVGFVVVSSVQGWMQDIPMMPRTTVEFYLQSLQSTGYCAP
ncbi:MAG: hypothetical protein JNL01_12480 [Bdellovibrionales bacterium]|nr:hypothetical protein [Bdellovibrionales bacterium]